MANPFGLSKDEIPTTGAQFPDTLNLGQIPVGDSVTVTLVSDVPREVSFTRDGVDKKDLVLEVVSSEGVPQTIWLTAKSLKKEFMRVWMENDEHLAGLRVNIKVREYEHEKFGRVRGYTVRQLTQESV